MKTSDELKAQIEELEQRGRSLAQERERLEARIKDIGSELKEIYGIYSKAGELEKLAFEYKQAKHIEDDEYKPLPVWKTPESNTREEKIISKVTAKRIFLRARGDKHEVYYSRETGKSAYSGVLDVQATIAEWERYQETRKAITLETI